MHLKQLFTALTVFAALGAGINAAHASEIIGPISVTANPAGSFSSNFIVENLINQSGLSASYTSGVTDFTSFVGSTTHASPSDSSGGGYASAAGVTTVTFDFDFGAVVSLDQFAIWNDRDSQAVDLVQLFSATDATFATLSSLGTFNPVVDPLPVFAQIFDMTDATTQFIRMTASNTDNGAVIVNFGEVAFDGSLGPSTSVPEPASLAIFVIGLAGLGLIRRRRRTA